MATLAERLDRIERLLTEPPEGWRLIPLLEQARTAHQEVATLSLAIAAAEQRKALAVATERRKAAGRAVVNG